MEEGIRDLKKKKKKKPYNLRNEIIVLYQNKRIVPFYNSLKFYCNLYTQIQNFGYIQKFKNYFCYNL